MNIPHPRCVLLFEGDEESGSEHLDAYLKKMIKKVGDPSIVFCLDSDTLDYEHFSLTTSLRGIVLGNLTVKILKEGVHSGAGSGFVPSSFRILRLLLDRIENSKTGIVVDDFWVDIPADRYKEATDLCKTFGKSLLEKFPYVGNMSPVSKNPLVSYLNATWRPTLCITGAEGLPNLQNAGNVLRPLTTVKLSIRIPPTLNPEDAKKALIKLVTENPPYGAEVTLTGVGAGEGWNAPSMPPYLSESIKKAAMTFYKKEPLMFGDGCSIPLICMLNGLFPKA